MLELDKKNFEEEVLKAEGLVMVDFWSPKCEPCKALMPHVAELAENYQEKAKFCKLDTASNRRLSISQKVMGLPTIAFYKNGEKIAELTKDIAIEDVEAKLKELL
ncbi:MAG: thioredoxin domain-containing protein [Syntrophaceticus sp.]|jgi:thioredoxin 1|nr:thioredoxin domain-containing protein [Syntrophaceticus sp.]MDD4359254.1 thioredoxin domain-containing protein [Syntrophaceticus sp.]MDD4782102.1 thioredoxin domain-containing protein [Syntrophaceticus sp.]